MMPTSNHYGRFRTWLARHPRSILWSSAVLVSTVGWDLIRGCPC